MTSKRIAIVSCLASLSLLLASCGTTSAAYADRVVGIAVTKGQVLEVRNLDSAKKEMLADGVAISITGDGCEVTMGFGSRTQVIRLVPNSVIVYGEKLDYILQPYAEVGTELEAPPLPPPAVTDRNVEPPQ
jgi:hypothetical protein